MTTRRIFECNFCRMKIEDDKGGIGLEWANMFTLRQTHYLREAETHLCICCNQALTQLFAKVEDAGEQASNCVTLRVTQSFTTAPQGGEETAAPNPRVEPPDALNTDHGQSVPAGDTGTPGGSSLHADATSPFTGVALAKRDILGFLRRVTVA